MIALTAAVLTISPRKRLVMVLWGGNLPLLFQRRPRLARAVLGRSDELIVPSTYLAQAAERMGLEVSVIPNGIDIDQYPFRLRRSLSPRLLWLRTFHEIYDPILAIDAVASLATEYPDITLTMAGSDRGALQETRVHAVRRGVERHVRFLGFLRHHDKIRELNASDVFVNTSRIDNDPVSVLEATVCGLPVVSTDVGGITHVLRDGKTAMLVRPEDPRALATAIRRLLENPDLSGQLSSAAREQAEHRDWDRVLPAWERGLTGRPN